MPDVTVITFGCRLNTYESEVIRAHAVAGDAATAGPVVVVNTCAVTGEAERQARQAIRKARRDHPEARIVVTGCAAQINPAAFAAMPEVDQVLGNAEKLAASSFTAPPAGRVHVADIALIRETAGHLITGIEGRTRAFVQVQQGCDHHCTFCIIPQGRGPSRSLSQAAVVAQVQTLVAHGYSEVVLSGVDITSWGADLPDHPRLGGLVAAVLAGVPDLARLRLSSLDPAALDPELWAVLADEPRLMPHLHLSLQAGDDMILKRMGRRHRRDDILALCSRVRQVRPDVVFGADMIAGFPTEDEAMARHSLAMVDEAGLTWLHVFPFSARPGTPAARMPALPGTTVRERAARLREAGEVAVARFLDSRLGRVESVLVEKAGLGRTEQFAEVAMTGGLAGQIVPARMTESDGRRLTGEQVREAA